MKIAFILLTIILSTSCIAQDVKPKEIQSINTKYNENIDLTDTANFTLVKDYIRSVATIKKVNASSISDQELLVTYYTVDVGNLEISIDHSDRIYMTYNNRHFGNILKENSIVKPEINYGIPDKNPRLTKKKEFRVLEIYKKLIILALDKKNKP